MMQDNNLVYYLVHVNDVYAYFLTEPSMRKDNASPTIVFPTSQSDLNAVKTYAKKSFPDEKVLVVELKSSWIELPHSAGILPTRLDHGTSADFDMSSDTKWKRIGLRPATLAMVGMHIAFSVQGHQS